MTEPKENLHKACTDLFSANLHLLESIEEAKGKLKAVIEEEGRVKGQRHWKTGQLAKIFAVLCEGEERARGMLK